MNLQPVDKLLALGHGKIRSIDCIIAVKLSVVPTQDELLERAKLTQKIFPKTSVHAVLLSTSSTLEDFSNSPLPSVFHLELGIIGNEGILALKMSHILGDAVSMILWLKCLLGNPGQDQPLKLKSFPPKKDTPYRKVLNSEVWPPSVSDIGKERSVRCFTLNHTGQDVSRLNDIMILSLLESLKLKRKSIWIPVNVREKFWQGFGNGLSRMRIYPADGQNTQEKLLHIRKQKKESFKNGEVALPPENLDVDHPLKRSLYKMWIRRPWADWGSISLSHITESENIFGSFENVWGVSNIMPKHHAALFVVSKADKSDLTLCFDRKTVSPSVADALLADFRKEFAKIINQDRHEQA